MARLLKFTLPGHKGIYIHPSNVTSITSIESSSTEAVTCISTVDGKHHCVTEGLDEVLTDINDQMSSHYRY
jgi:hypothetical protein